MAAALQSFQQPAVGTQASLGSYTYRPGSQSGLSQNQIPNYSATNSGLPSPSQNTLNQYQSTINANKTQQYTNNNAFQPINPQPANTAAQYAPPTQQQLTSQTNAGTFFNPINQLIGGGGDVVNNYAASLDAYYGNANARDRERMAGDLARRGLSSSPLGAKLEGERSTNFFAPANAAVSGLANSMMMAAIQPSLAAQQQIQLAETNARLQKDMYDYYVTSILPKMNDEQRAQTYAMQQMADTRAGVMKSLGMGGLSSWNDSPGLAAQTAMNNMFVSPTGQTPNGMVPAGVVEQAAQQQGWGNDPNAYQWTQDPWSTAHYGYDPGYDPQDLGNFFPDQWTEDLYTNDMYNDTGGQYTGGLNW